MVIVDTTVWVDYLNGLSTRHTDWLERELDRQRLGLTDLILGEVLQGVRDERQAAETRRALLRFEVFTIGGVELAVTAAQNYRALRARGHTIRRTIDCWIATFCLLNAHSLLHTDHDFNPFEQHLACVSFTPDFPTFLAPLVCPLPPLLAAGALPAYAPKASLACPLTLQIL
jgi:predicted nucleic acid-binding protein